MYRNRYRQHGGSIGMSGMKIRLMIGLALAAWAVFSYYGSTEYNEITGEKQRVAMSPEQEIALGLQSAPQMAMQHGGLHPDARAQAHLDEIGARLVRDSSAKDSNWNWEFHLLRDSDAVNAFALPGGQIFMTAALYSRLKNDDQVAGVIGHEIAHVIARHGAEHLAKQQLTQGLTGAATVAAGSQGMGRMAQMIGQMVNMKYGRADEIESDYLGVRFMTEAGYNPYALIDVMKILAEATGGNRESDFFSTHPNPENRIEKIKDAIKEFAGR